MGLKLWLGGQTDGTGQTCGLLKRAPRPATSGRNKGIAATSSDVSVGFLRSTWSKRHSAPAALYTARRSRYGRRNALGHRGAREWSVPHTESTIALERRRRTGWAEFPVALHGAWTLDFEAAVACVPNTTRPTPSPTAEAARNRLCLDCVEECLKPRRHSSTKTRSAVGFMCKPQFCCANPDRNRSDDKTSENTKTNSPNVLLIGNYVVTTTNPAFKIFSRLWLYR